MKALMPLILTSILLMAPRTSSASETWSSYLQLAPFVGLTEAFIFGQGSVPSYKGITYGAEVVYLVGTPTFSLGPFFALKHLSLDNTANSALQEESLTGSVMNYGLLAVSDFMYLRASLGQLSLEDKVRGEVSNTTKLKALGIELGAGLTYRVTPMIWTSLGLDINHFKLDPASNPIATRLDYLSYTLVFNLSFGLPSGPTRIIYGRQPRGAAAR